MKTTLALLILAGSLAAARAQDAADVADPAAVVAVPAITYDAPVVYNAPVVYEQPVVYNAPVYYPAPACAPVACNDTPAPRSTVLYIGGGSVRYQVSRCNSGSTVTVIGSHFR